MTRSQHNNNNSQYVGHTPGIHSIQEKDDIFETDEVFKSEFAGNMSKISNHYEVPNMTSMLYEFTNKE